MKVITFPPDERDDIRKRIADRNPVFSVRVSREYGKYREGDELETEWGDRLIVREVIAISGGIEELKKRYRFFDHLDERMLSEVRPYRNMDILTLEPVSDHAS